MGPPECVCDAPTSTASGAMPHRWRIRSRAATTTARVTKGASRPTSATRVVPSSSTAARAFSGSCTSSGLWKALP